MPRSTTLRTFCRRVIMPAQSPQRKGDRIISVRSRIFVGKSAKLAWILSLVISIGTFNSFSQTLQKQRGQLIKKSLFSDIAKR